MLHYYQFGLHLITLTHISRLTGLPCSLPTEHIVPCDVQDKKISIIHAIAVTFFVMFPFLI
jgi:hypothetical protein